MDYKTAVQAALNGEDDGFAYLYKMTYAKMYHKALYYVKNKSDAEDVLQDSYIKAELSLSTLEEPDKFPSWFSEIVVNTSKNYLKKKNRKPLYFFGLLNDSQDKEFDGYDVRDEDNSFQPEEAYSEKEIRIIFGEMINSLSDEQRVCILLHHFDEQTVSEIADTMRCSEGTVKSRLFYGRKALRKKIEGMEEKGYKFYGAAPIPILKYFMEKDSMTSEFLQGAADSMKNSEIAVITKANSASNLTTISAFKSAVVQKSLACCAAAFVIGGGVFASFELADFNGFAELLNIKNEMIESDISSSRENSSDTDIDYNNIFDTDTISNITDIKNTKDTKDADDTVRMISNGNSSNESKGSNNMAGSVSNSSKESSRITDSDKPEEYPKTVTVTENTVQVPQSTEISSQSADEQTSEPSDSLADNREEERKKFIYESYSQVLDNLAEKETDENRYEYYLLDMDNDGITDLLTVNYEGSYIYGELLPDSSEESGNNKLTGEYRLYYTFEVYSYSENDSGYELKKMEGSYTDGGMYFDLNRFLISNKNSGSDVRPKSDYDFSSIWNYKSAVGSWQYDDNVYFIFDESVVSLLNKDGDKFEGWNYFEEDYYDDVTLFEHHSLYNISDRVPLQELSK